jgi:hypothetical protein
MTKIISLQFALFFTSVSERPDLDFGDLNEKMLNLYDAMPTMRSFPKDLPLPPDIPLITYQSELGDYVCNISRSRIDFIRSSLGKGGDSERMMKDFNVKVAAFIKYVLSKRSANRFGLVCSFFVDDVAPVSTLLEKYFKPGFEHVEELSIRFNHKKEIEGRRINDVISLSAATEIDEAESREGLLIQRDLNSDPSQTEDYNIETLQAISKACSEFVKISSVEDLVK